MSGVGSRLNALAQQGQDAALEFARFVVRPRIDRSALTADSGRVALFGWLLLISFGVTAVFGLLALPVILSTNVSPSEGIQRVFDRSPFQIIVMVVIAGPLIEEMMFRGWLTGTYQAMVGTAGFLAVFYGLAFFTEASGAFAQLGIAATALLVFVMIQFAGKPVRPSWFERAFPVFFWLQAIVFGGLHLANIQSASIAVPLLMACSLTICGLLFGYARITLGFGAAWLLHLAYNLPSALILLTVMGGAEG